MTFKPNHAEKVKKDDNCLFFQDYFIIFDEIITKPYCSGSQTEVPNSLCLPDYWNEFRDFHESPFFKVTKFRGSSTLVLVF